LGFLSSGSCSPLVSVDRRKQASETITFQHTKNQDKGETNSWDGMLSK
jgi:hypothetical protein